MQEMEATMFAMRIEWCGTLPHQRFLLNDGHDHFWTGNGWSPRLRDARLYISHQDACQVFKVLAEDHFANMPTREFQVLTRIKVYARTDYGLEELRQWLADATTLVILSGKGYGPVEGSLAVVVIPWDELHEQS
jgi:hypothetical protein